MKKYLSHFKHTFTSPYIYLYIRQPTSIQTCLSAYFSSSPPSYKHRWLPVQKHSCPLVDKHSYFPSLPYCIVQSIPLFSLLFHVSLLLPISLPLLPPLPPLFIIAYVSVYPLPLWMTLPRPSNDLLPTPAPPLPSQDTYTRPQLYADMQSVIHFAITQKYS